MGDGTKENPYTRKDVLRLIEENDGKAEGLDLSGKVFEKDIDLSCLALTGVKLNNVQLFRANFNGSNLDRATMQNTYLGYATFNPPESKAASLEGVDLRNSNLHDAEFKKANLICAQFQEVTVFHPDTQEKGLLILPASIERTDFRGANLFRANFKGCYFYGTKLEGAFIRGADIFEAHLDEADWGSYILGEEIKYDFNSREDTKGDFYSSEHYYRRLKVCYTQAGIYDMAGEFFFREMTVKRKMLKWWPNPIPRAWSKFLSLLVGYGERPLRVVASAAVVILGLAAAYYLLGGLTLPYSLYYSAVSFSALGYGTWASTPTEYWVQGVGAFESFIGILMVVFFSITFVRKMTR